MHESATCVLHCAIDHEVVSSNPSLVSSKHEFPKIALKFMKQLDQFTREVSVRGNGNFDGTYVINVLRDHNSLTDVKFSKYTKSRGFADYPYLIVMPLAERSLHDILSKERIAGSDWHIIRVFSSSIGKFYRFLQTILN